MIGDDWVRRASSGHMVAATVEAVILQWLSIAAERTCHWVVAFAWQYSPGCFTPENTTCLCAFPVEESLPYPSMGL